MGKAAAGKFALLLFSVMGVGAAFTMAPRVSDLALYNHSTSMPPGFYRRSDAPVDRGAIVTVRACDVAPALAAGRGFDGPRHRFIKRVAAVEGDHVCADDTFLQINGASAWPMPSPALEGQAPTAWTGCRKLGAGEVFLLGDTPDSFDGRYWGPIETRLMEGVWRKL